jgi:hypothetical protein
MTGDKPLYSANSRSLNLSRPTSFLSLLFHSLTHLHYRISGIDWKSHYSSPHSVSNRERKSDGMLDRSWKSDIKSGQTRQEKDGHNFAFYLSSNTPTLVCVSGSLG